MSHSILTVGSLAFDSIQTPSGKADQVLGGSVNYFSVAASFYTHLNVVGVVGEDFPKNHLDWMSSRGIDVTGVEVQKGKTFHWVGQYDQNLNEAQTLSTALNVFEHFNPKLTEHHKKSDILFLANIDPTLQLSVLNQIQEPKLIAMDSMNFWITGKRDELLKTLRKIDILSINEGEAYLLSGQKTLVAAAETIRGMGPNVLIIKRGEYGAALFTSGGIFLAPAYLVPKVIDPTGAGDSFAGAFIGYLAKHKVHRDLAKTSPQEWEDILRRAVIAGCVMASFTVEDFSLHRLMRLQKEELIAREKSLLRMISLNS